MKVIYFLQLAPRFLAGSTCNSFICKRHEKFEFAPVSRDMRGSIKSISTQPIVFADSVAHRTHLRPMDGWFRTSTSPAHWNLPGRRFQAVEPMRVVYWPETRRTFSILINEKNSHVTNSIIASVRNCRRWTRNNVLSVSRRPPHQPHEKKTKKRSQFTGKKCRETYRKKVRQKVHSFQRIHFISPQRQKE